MLAIMRTTPATGPPQALALHKPTSGRRLIVPLAVVLLAAGGISAGVAVAVSGPPSQLPQRHASAVPTAAYAYYQQLMGRYGHQPGSMMGTSTDMGKVMGALFANAPGPRISAADATRLGNQIPAGASADRTTNSLVFTTANVTITVLASPSMSTERPAENFQIAGMTNPAISVPAGAQVTIDFINADGDMAHGLVVTSPGAVTSRMPMMTAAPAFGGAATWFLGETTAAGMHEATINFTASSPGTYEYICPVPGHAQEGMAGGFAVR
ncbi:MAG TPA: sulfocyanin-like copper-binding protein [Acidimicrobiales bacterium]|nr:sulfocyanin-like copper-binding protein [Acidimicrobiales bacterium]